MPRTLTMGPEGRGCTMSFAWLFWGWRRPLLDRFNVVFFARQGCHLCEDAWTLLQAEQRRHRFTLSLIDVDSDPELVKAYGTCVPVVMVNGRVRFRGRINEALWRRLLRAEASRQPGEPGA